MRRRATPWILLELAIAVLVGAALAVPLLITPEPAFLAQLDARLDRLLATHP